MFLGLYVCVPPRECMRAHTSEDHWTFLAKCALSGTRMSSPVGRGVVQPCKFLAPSVQGGKDALDKRLCQLQAFVGRPLGGVEAADCAGQDLPDPDE